ncbi:type III secretion protein Q [Mesorhizobium sp. J18]|uniref:type III secretion system cytoplasmic ring protein SctQ n=1 Tax=Mesorhizobium sp. J18 TaxID=935263 RepID=UPI001199ABF0|nr:type III secretion system cytoplasmic ring protein SctQ [Mesorhizobium sp. J18]TWG99542.1 type III secretion protein Q [Mesorhizobium sp. J18]
MPPALTAEKTKKKRRAPATGKARPKAAALPLRKIEPAGMAAFNAVYRCREPLQFMIAEDAFLLAAEWTEPSTVPAAASAIRFSIDGEPGELILPSALIEEWVDAIDPEADRDRLAPEHFALLVECLLGGELSRLEAYFDCRIVFAAIQREATAPDGNVLTFSLERGGDVMPCVLQLEPAWAARLGHALDAIHGAKPPLRLDIPASVSIWRGVTVISVADLRSLRPGDVIVPEEMNTDQDAAVAIIADRFAVPVKAVGEGWLLTAGLGALAATKWEWTMDQTKKPSTVKVEDSDLEELPVTLVFEVGRMAMPLREVSGLTPGAVIEVTDMSSLAVDLLANGKRIGRGEIVRIGDGFGVQVTRIFGNA